MHFFKIKVNLNLIINKKTIKKRQIIKNKPIEYEIKVYNDSIETLTWTEKTFLRCENDDSDIFFFKFYDKKIQI